MPIKLTEEQKKEKKRESSRKYRQSEKGKMVLKRAYEKYKKSEKGRIVARRAYKKYEQSEKGKIKQMRYLLKKKKERIRIKLLRFVFQLLNAGYNIKVSEIIDYSINSYLYKIRLVNERNIH